MWRYYGSPLTYLDDPETWSRTWTIIAGMKGLRELRLTMSALEPHTLFPQSLSELVWFRPLKIPKPEIYEVDLHFQPSDELLEFLADAPFSIKCGSRPYASVGSMIARRLPCP